MKRCHVGRRERGFALLLTLSLLGLLLMVALTLAALARIGAQLTATARAQAQARQNALLGLGVALGELQRYAGEDNRVTGMAGIAGMPAGPNSPTRQWCGVWDGGGSLLAWLASRRTAGAVPTVLPPPASVRLVGVNSVGNSAGLEDENREFVWADKIVIAPVLPDVGSVPLGDYAYWVGDEGVKLSACIPAASAALPGLAAATDEIISGLAPGAATDAVLVFNQLAFVPPTPLSAVGLAPGFHQVTVTHALLDGGSGGLRTGAINVNSTSSLLWRGVAGTYNLANPGHPLAISPLTFGNRMRNGFPAATGKASNGPFLTPAACLGGSNLLPNALAGSGVTPAQFTAALGSLFSVRSDTFRVRSYGDALNPADPTRIEAVAYAEALVQRTLPPGPTGVGRRFVIITFRWLSAGDL